MKFYSEYMMGICEYDFDLEHEHQKLTWNAFRTSGKRIYWLRSSSLD